MPGGRELSFALQMEFEELYSSHISALFSLHIRRSYGGENVAGIEVFFSRKSTCVRDSHFDAIVSEVGQGLIQHRIPFLDIAIIS